MVGYNFKSNDIYAEAFALDAKCLAMYNQGNLQACVFVLPACRRLLCEMG